MRIFHSFFLFLAVTYAIQARPSSFVHPMHRALTVEEDRDKLRNEVLDLGGQIVCENLLAEENLSTINCHGYACRRNRLTRIPLWIKNNRIRSILRIYFRHIKSLPESNIAQIENDKTLRKNDLVLFNQHPPFLPASEYPFYIHSGLIVPQRTSKGAKYWIRSKIGKLMTVDLPPAAVCEMYKEHHITVEIWRRVKRKKK